MMSEITTVVILLGVEWNDQCGWDARNGLYIDLEGDHQDENGNTPIYMYPATHLRSVHIY